MSFSVRFNPLAELELREAADYYGQAAPGLREAFLDEVERGYRRLAEHSEVGASVGTSARKLVLDRLPYSLFYAIHDDCVRILAVGHQSRRPLYWRKRV